MRHTARAIIINDKKLLLLTGHGAGFYWTPGGGIEENETTIEALHREIHEELGVQIVTSSHYLSYEYDDQHVTNYLVDIDEQFSVGNEITDFIWYGKGDKVQLSKGLEFVVIPRLISDGYL